MASVQVTLQLLGLNGDALAVSAYLHIRGRGEGRSGTFSSFSIVVSVFALLFTVGRKMDKGRQDSYGLAGHEDLPTDELY